MSGRTRWASTAEVRTWARENGFDVGSRGHLSLKVIEAFNEAPTIRRRHVKYVSLNPMLAKAEQQASA